MKLTTLRHRTKMVFATSVAGLMLLGTAAPAVAQPSGADFAAEIEELPRNEALRKLGVKNPETFTGPVSRLIPSRDGSVDTPYEREAAAQLSAEFGRRGNDSATRSTTATRTQVDSREDTRVSSQTTRTSSQRSGQDNDSLQLLDGILDLDQLL